MHGSTPCVQGAHASMYPIHLPTHLPTDASIHPRKKTKHSMVCFPYAGGNSNFYKNWDFKDTEMILVELPGRNA